MSVVRIPGFGTVKIHTEDFLPPKLGQPSYVLDGDNIVVGGRNWRIDGYDAPPLPSHSSPGPHCHKEGEIGLRAKQFLEALIQDAGTRDAVHLDILKNRERHGRQMVRLFIDDRNLAEIMVEHELARYFDGRSKRHRFCGCSEN